jgi:hypothetical protein
MRTAIFVLTCVLGSLLAPADGARAADKGNDPSNRVGRLITQLGNDAFVQREAAMKQLEAIGPPALEALRKSVNSPDPEIKRRVRELVQRLEKRAETEKALAPTKVRLSCKDTPLNEVLAGFAKKSGATLAFQGDRARLTERRLTLDTGEVPFWQALDQVCRKAGLADSELSVGAELRTGRPQPPGGRALPPVIEARQAVNRPIEVFRGDVAGLSGAAIALRDGAAEALPTFVSGALRVRALADRTGHLATAGQTGVNLAVAVEPKLTLRAIKRVRVEKAVDDRGQTLEPAPADVAAPRVDATLRMERMTRRRRGNERPPHQQTVAVHFKRADMPSHALKELKGVLVAQVMTPPEPVVTIADVRKATGQTARGKNGGAVTVHGVSVQRNGDVRLRVTVEPPSSADNPGTVTDELVVIANGQGQFIQAQRVQVRLARQMQAQRALNLGFADVDVRVVNPSAAGLALFDAKGKKYQQRNVSVDVMVTNNVPTQQLVITFSPTKGRAEPAKLVYTAPRSITVEVPFTLHDVKLP